MAKNASQNFFSAVGDIAGDIWEWTKDVVDIDLSFDWSSDHSKEKDENEKKTIIAGVSPETLTLVLIIIAGAFAYQIARK